MAKKKKAPVPDKNTGHQKATLTPDDTSEIKAMATLQKFEKIPTASDKQYIFDNYQKMAVKEIADNTGLNAAQINKLIASPELDAPPAMKNADTKPLRRFATDN